MSKFEKSDFGSFYSDFVTPATIAGVTGFEVLYTKEELEIDQRHGIFPVFRSTQRHLEDSIVVMNPGTADAETYVIIGVQPLEYNEWQHVLQNA